MQPLVNMVAKLMLMNKPSWMFCQEPPADQGNVSNHWILKTVQELNFLRKPNQIFKDSFWDCCSTAYAVLMVRPSSPIPYHHHQHKFSIYPWFSKSPRAKLGSQFNTKIFMITNILFSFWNCDGQFKPLARRVNSQNVF